MDTTKNVKALLKKVTVVLLVVISNLLIFTSLQSKAQSERERVYTGINLLPQDSGTLDAHPLELMLITSSLVVNLDAGNLNGPAASSTTSTTTWTDLSTNMNNGILTNFASLNPPSATSGWDGTNTIANPSVLKFDGVDDQVVVSNSSSVDITSPAITGSAWINLASTPSGDYSILTKRVAYYFVVDSSRSLGAFIYGTTPQTWFTSNSKIPLNTWTNVAFTYDGSNIKLFINGALDNSQTRSGNIDSTVQALVVGSVSNELSRTFNGKIGNTRLYNTALTVDQVRQNYLAEAYKFQGPDTVSPGVKGDESFLGQNYKKAGDTFNVYVEEINPVTNGDNDVNAISSVSCMLGSTALTNPSPTEQNFIGGLTFDGINDYVTVADSTSLNPTNFTLTALIKTSQTSPGRIITKPTVGGGQRYSLGVNVVSSNKAQIRFDTSDASGAVSATSTSNVNDSKWHYIAGVFDDSGDSLKIYVDGNLESTTSTTKTPVITTQNLNIGVFDVVNGEYFNGSIANARIYNRALSASEIALENRYRYEPINPQGLIAGYKLDDGNVASNLGTTALARKWDTVTNSIVVDAALSGTLNNFNFTNASGWVNQYSYNINKYTYTVPTFTGINQVEKLKCTVTDAAGNSTATNEEVGGVFISRVTPTVSTSVMDGQTIKTNESFTFTALDNTPDSSILVPTAAMISINGSAFSTPNCSASNLSKALDFDGVDDYIDLSTLTFADNFTWSAWVKPQQKADGSLWDHANGVIAQYHSGNFILEVGPAATSVGFYDGGVGSWINSNINLANAWHHLSATWSKGGTRQLYVDGVLVASGAASNSSPTADVVRIGFTGDFDRYFEGNIDDVQLYNRALSAQEISYLFNNPGKVFNPRGQFIWYRFDKLEDIDSNGISDNLRDYSGNNVNGYLINYGSLLSSAVVDSTITNAIDGRNVSCNTTVGLQGSSNPAGANLQMGAFDVSISNAAGQNGAVSKSSVTVIKDSPPLVNRPLDITIDGGKFFSIPVSASAPNGNMLTYSASGDYPSGPTINSQTGVFSGSIPCTRSGITTYNLTITATDQFGISSSASSQINIACNLSSPTGIVINPLTTPGTPVLNINQVVPPSNSGNEPTLGPTGIATDSINNNLIIINNVEFPRIPVFITPSQTINNDENIIIAGSPIVFALHNDQALSDVLRAQLLTSSSISLRVIDAGNKEQIIPAKAFLTTNADRNDDLTIVVYTTDKLLSSTSSGVGRIELLIDGQGKAAIAIKVVPLPLTIDQAQNTNPPPAIASMKVKRNGNVVRFVISGSNFIKGKTAISLMPRSSFRNVKLIVQKKKNRAIIIYRTLAKRIKGDVVLSLTTPSGQTISTVQVPTFVKQ